MNYIITSYYTYDNFIKENNKRINKKLKISTSQNYSYLFNNINEIFDSNIDDLDYIVKKNKSIHVNNDFDYVFYFKSKNNNEYRLDLFKLIENNINLKHIELHNKIFVAISFSLANRIKTNYDENTANYEMYDVLNRIKYIIEQYIKHYMKNNEILMYGKSDEQKEKIYDYLIKVCFPNYNLIIDYTTFFDENIGFYIVKNN